MTSEFPHIFKYSFTSPAHDVFPRLSLTASETTPFPPQSIATTIFGNALSLETVPN